MYRPKGSNLPWTKNRTLLVAFLCVAFLVIFLGYTMNSFKQLTIEHTPENTPICRLDYNTSTEPRGNTTRTLISLWLRDTGTDVTAIRGDCANLVPKRGPKFGGEYLNHLAEFEKTLPKGLINEGHSGDLLSQTWIYHVMSRKGHVRTVCETGFNAGHSTYVWLTSHPTSRVMSFDLGEHEYTRTMAEYLTLLYPARFTIFYGNSNETIPKFKDRITKSEPNFKCDIIIIDGGHTYDIAKADMDNFRSLAVPGHTVVVLDDYPSTMFDIEDIGQVWEEQKSQKIIAEIFRCCTRNRGFVVGYFI